MTELTGKTALVTGASRGIGKAVALALRMRGADVIGTYRQSAASAAELDREHGIRFHAVDLADPEAALRLGELLPDELDILINNAGIASFIPWGENTSKTIDYEFALNVRTPLLLTQYLGPRLRTGGRIIFLSSIVAKRAFGDGALVGYAATKGAIDTIVKQLAGPFGLREVTVNAVSPGPIDTDMSAWLRDKDGPEQAHAIQAIKRVGQPTDIADVISFLASPKGQWITGQTIEVGGGTLL
jgi:3-oxoacyl-[acyl-carrier protein] reductase